ncbi:PREDICTED: 25.3 kDa vesicle transport protein isoform X1 [Tarenaya hassleriana]|uniref:25.3 kDa vesicle transport protein isoform X1 n=1 Tax=Tarenaya hassleriana TaxID=28532 RepID=UPI00053C98F0|nr:PREDICTED: 25.3 kDa vesicle transport protein isoform X1 [Tarenaya hassleriana]
MLKLTIVGRVEDGLPLSQDGSSFSGNNSFLFYKKQAEFLLGEISSGSLLHPRMTVWVDHHSFHFLLEKNVCFITLSDSSYPRKLAFHFLQDLQMEFETFDDTLIKKISKPYSFVKFGNYEALRSQISAHVFSVWSARKLIIQSRKSTTEFKLPPADSIIRSIRKRYIDTRTQVNLSKLNACRKQDLDIISEHMQDIIQRRRIPEEASERVSPNPRTSVSSIWSSPCLEAIALKWTPVGIIVFMGLVLLQARLVLTDDYLISTMT